VAIVRVEQLYPFPEHEIRSTIDRYTKAAEIFWTQEEPRNRGAWSFVEPRLREMFADRLIDYRGRAASASPAAGSLKMHTLEEQELAEDALELSPRPVSAAT
jgi:2-oxoglutarate dehydrogenase E1 component